MRAVVQRVSEGSVEVGGSVVGQICGGLLFYLGVGKGDGAREAAYIAGKVAGLRIYEDADGRMNHSVVETGGAVLLISQFTLYGDCRKGRRPSFDGAADPEIARDLYERVGELLRGEGLEVETGEFGAHMHVESVNDGPVTFLLDSDRNF